MGFGDIKRIRLNVKTTYVVLLASCVCMSLLCSKVSLLAANEVETRVMSSRASIKELAENLKGYLQAGLESSVSAEEKLLMCKSGALEATSLIEEEKGFRVRRTSLRVRNPDNTPDAWESKVLEQFQMRRQSGDKIAVLDYAEILDDGQVRQFRYMKAIPVGKVCVICHGKAIDPELIFWLGKIYPGDRARGFEVGEIRGAFTVTQGID